MAQREHLEGFLQHEEHLRLLVKNGEDGFMKEFMALKQQSMRYKTEKTYSTVEGERDCNIRKNRYKDILPFDYTRIVLPEIEDAEGMDYINANYITGLDGKKVYVAAQGPLPHTVIDFWRLLWETGVEVVIMACNEYESGKHKCERYWADEQETKQFGTITVTLIKQLKVTPDFLIRTLKVKNQGEEKVLNQFHYTAWPDHGVPKTVQPIMEMIKLFREYLPNEDSMVVMHCSAGCGRTGTMICIDYVRALLKTGNIGPDFCLYDIIMEMRRQRPAIVQTRDQYELVHRAVAWLFRQELGLAPNPLDYDHLYENVTLQPEGPRMPPSMTNLTTNVKTAQLKLSPKQRRQKEKEHENGHKYINHVIQGKAIRRSKTAPKLGSIHVRRSPISEGGTHKILKPPSLPTKQPRESDSDGTVSANVQEKTDTEEGTSDNAIPSPALTPKHSPLAQERFESGYKNTLAAFKEFETSSAQSMSPSASAADPVKPDTVKPALRQKPTPEPRILLMSRSFDLDLAKPLPRVKPQLTEKPALSDKPTKGVPSSQRPVLATKPIITWKKDPVSVGSSQAKEQVSGFKRRPTSEPVPASVEKIQPAQFQQVKNQLQATLMIKGESDVGKESDSKHDKEKNSSKSRPNSGPPKPPMAVVKPTTKSPITKHQYEECVTSPSDKDDKHETTKGFQYQIQPIASVKLQSHRDKFESGPKQFNKKTIDSNRPQQPIPKNKSSNYMYAVQPVSVIEKLKDTQAKPQLRTGQGLSYATAYADGNANGNPKDETKSPKILDDYSYSSEVIIPITPGNTGGNIKKYSPKKQSSKESSAYEIIEIKDSSSQRSSDGAPRGKIPVFDKEPGDYNEPVFNNDKQGFSGQPRESVKSSSTSWASFTDEDYDEDDEVPPSIPEKTSGAYQVVDGEVFDETGSGSGSKWSQFLSNQRDKLATHKEKLTSNTNRLFNKIGDVVRNAPATNSSQSSSPSLSTSPQPALVSDLNEIIKKTLREYEPTYKEEPIIYNNLDISFPKHVAKPKSPPSPPNGWIKPDSHSTSAPVEL